MRGELDALKREVRQRQGSEEQMKQVLAEYERTISELIAEKEKDQQKFSEEKAKLAAERDQVRTIPPLVRLCFVNALYTITNLAKVEMLTGTSLSFGRQILNFLRATSDGLKAADLYRGVW